ncbi:MAG: helix-turn-helix domain-containing protein [Clostridiales bacterium]|jgi:excisionase family DNA binding protein|nr:helix-turn-helix domain-containing protein [Clostridiales bacterium]DAG13004.1 MAG TPA: helix-turn-helix domain protein [Caudoviricetes sp.]DAR04613.1 MAG TPA: helix-turn-helix domain protein [Caudoviricetes sp.]
MEQILYTVKEVAELFHTNPTYIYALIKTGLLPALKLGSYKVRKDAVDNFLKQYEGCDLTDPYKFTGEQQNP